MNKFWSYISAFLAGALVIAIGILIYLLKNAKPVINADNYIEALNQSIKKLKQSGENNTQDVILDTVVSDTKEVKEKESFFKRIFGKKKVIN